MDPSTIGVLGGMMLAMVTVILTVVIYLDRSRRADINRLDLTLRAEMAAGFKQVNDRIDRLEAVVLELVKTVSEIKGRLDVLAPALPQAEAPTTDQATGKLSTVGS